MTLATKAAICTANVLTISKKKSSPIYGALEGRGAGQRNRGDRTYGQRKATTWPTSAVLVNAEKAI